MDESPPLPADPVKLRALIVDDEAPARERLRRLLEELGDVEVVGEATNGAEALDRCAALDPDVVLLDVRMPGMDGIEAARHLGALDEPPAVIFTTAYDEYALAAFESQAVGYLLKPVRREKLARAMRHAARVAGTATGPARRPVAARPSPHADLRASRRPAASSCQSRTSCISRPTRST